MRPRRGLSGGRFTNVAALMTGAGVTLPSYASGAFTATDSADGGHPAQFFNISTQSVTIGAGQALIAFVHSEFPATALNSIWIQRGTYAGMPGRLIVLTDGYSGGVGNKKYWVWIWAAPTVGTANLVIDIQDIATNVTDSGANELTVAYAVFNNAAQITLPIRSVTKDISAANRTSETEIVTSGNTDLILHAIASGLQVVGALGAGETSRIVANEAGKDNASILVSTKAGAAGTTTVSSTGWASSVIEGLGLSLMPAGTVENLNVFVDTFTRADESPLTITNWTAITNAAVFAINLVTNQAVGATALENLRKVNTATKTFGNDQRARIRYVGAQFGGVCVRFQGVGASCYCLSSNGNNQLDLLKLTDNAGATVSYTNIGPGGASVPTGAGILHAGDFLELEAIGTTLNVYWNQVLLFTATDASYAAGQPGLRVFGADAFASYFEATDGTVRW